MCFIINVIIAKQNFSALHIYLLIIFKVQLSSKYILKQEFKPKYAQIKSFSLKNRKNCPALGADPLCLRQLGSTLLDPPH